MNREISWGTMRQLAAWRFSSRTIPRTKMVVEWDNWKDIVQEPRFAMHQLATCSTVMFCSSASQNIWHHIWHHIWDISSYSIPLHLRFAAMPLAGSHRQHSCTDSRGHPEPFRQFSLTDIEGTYSTSHLRMGQNPIPLVNIKIAGKWMFIPLKMVLIGIDPYPSAAIICNHHVSVPLWLHS